VPPTATPAPSLTRRGRPGRPPPTAVSPPDAPRGARYHPGFRGFGCCPTDIDGNFGILTLKPGPVPGPNGPQAPHSDVSLFARAEEHTSELQSRFDLVCRL